MFKFITVDEEIGHRSDNVKPIFVLTWVFVCFFSDHSYISIDYFINVMA